MSPESVFDTCTKNETEGRNSELEGVRKFWININEQTQEGEVYFGRIFLRRRDTRAGQIRWLKSVYPEKGLEFRLDKLAFDEATGEQVGDTHNGVENLTPYSVFVFRK